MDLEMQKLMSQHEAINALQIDWKTFRKYWKEGVIVPIGSTVGGRLMFSVEHINSLKAQFKPRTRSYAKTQ